jgi:hypothetical protein
MSVLPTVQVYLYKQTEHLEGFRCLYLETSPESGFLKTESKAYILGLLEGNSKPRLLGFFFKRINFSAPTLRAAQR